MQIKDIEVLNLNLFIISFLFSKRGARLFGHHNDDHGPTYLPAVLSTIIIIMMKNPFTYSDDWHDVNNNDRSTSRQKRFEILLSKACLGR